jgi:hypothetical protein
MDVRKGMGQEEENPMSDLHSIAEELYFWLMRSTSEPKTHADTFQILSQILRIVQMSNKGGNYLPESKEKEAFLALLNIKEQVQDGKVQRQHLFEAIQAILQRLIYENPKAELIAHATEIEYIFCIHSKYSSSEEADYRQRFKKYLKILTQAVQGPLSTTEARAITQIMRQIVKNPQNFSKDPHKTLMDSLKKSGISVIIRPSSSEESQSA